LSYKNQTKVERLLEKLCIELGFCLAQNACAQIQSNLPLSVDAFINMLFESEGLNPQYEKQLRLQVRSRVVELFHAEVTNELA
jgi:hypothetical protein